MYCAPALPLCPHASMCVQSPFSYYPDFNEISLFHFISFWPIYVFPLKNLLACAVMYPNHRCVCPLRSILLLDDRRFNNTRTNSHGAPYTERFKPNYASSGFEPSSSAHTGGEERVRQPTERPIVSRGAVAVGNACGDAHAGCRRSLWYIRQVSHPECHQRFTRTSKTSARNLTLFRLSAYNFISFRDGSAKS